MTDPMNSFPTVYTFMYSACAIFLGSLLSLPDLVGQTHVESLPPAMHLVIFITPTS